MVKDERYELLVLLLAQEADERLGLERLAKLDRGEAVLSKAEVKVARDCHRGTGQLCETQQKEGREGGALSCP